MPQFNKSQIKQKSLKKLTGSEKYQCFISTELHFLGDVFWFSTKVQFIKIQVSENKHNKIQKVWVSNFIISSRCPWHNKQCRHRFYLWSVLKRKVPTISLQSNAEGELDHTMEHNVVSKACEDESQYSCITTAVWREKIYYFGAGLCDWGYISSRLKLARIQTFQAHCTLQNFGGSH